MTQTTTDLQTELAAFLVEDAKFETGNSAAGTRARNHLSNIAKLCKTRRNEITATKHARKGA